MTQMDAPRRSPVLAVMLAIVFLAVIGASVGYILGTNSKKPGQNVAGDQISTPTPATLAPTSPATSNAGGQQPTSPATKTSSSTKTYATPTKDHCPDYTIEAANHRGGKADYRVRLYIKTNKSEVWICMDANFKLFYQGHVLGRPFNGATTNGTLFLTTVEPRDHDYKATNSDGSKTTYYLVSPTALVIEYSNGTSETQNVVDYFQQ
jgi:hypothetical protein